VALVRAAGAGPRQHAARRVPRDDAGGAGRVCSCSPGRTCSARRWYIDGAYVLYYFDEDGVEHKIEGSEIDVEAKRPNAGSYVLAQRVHDEVSGVDPQ
jgi:hypothetical protein